MNEVNGVVVRQCVCNKCGESFEATKSAGMATHPNCWPQICGVCTSDSRLRIRTCSNCGNQYRKADKGYNKYCSDVCRDLKRYRQQGMEMRACIRCGTTFPTSKRKPICDECSEEHKAARDESRRERTGICERCGCEFVCPVSGKRRYCVSCGNKKERERITSWRKSIRSRQPKLHDTARVGTQGEVLFDLCCIRNGWQCCKSIYDQQPQWDRIVCRVEKTWERVQIKSFRSSKWNDQRILVSGHSRLSVAIIDTLGMVDVDTGGVWMVPMADGISRSICLSEYDNCYFNAIIDCE